MEKERADQSWTDSILTLVAQEISAPFESTKRFSYRKLSEYQNEYDISKTTSIMKINIFIIFSNLIFPFV